MPPEIRRLADQYLYDPVTVKVKTATLTVDTVEQFALEVTPRDKADRLSRCSQPSAPTQAIVFVRTKIALRPALPARSATAGMNVKALHGDMTQGARDGVMISFKDGRLPLLVATDVAARGLDISGISHVINYDVPTSPDVYVHRIGRTGRVGSQRPRDHVLRAAPAARDRGDREATPASSSRRGSKDAHVAPTPVTAKPRRHSKPHDCSTATATARPAS